jgi:hypothetical protein
VVFTGDAGYEMMPFIMQSGGGLVSASSVLSDH